MNRRRRALPIILSGGAPPVDYLIQDNFTTDDAAPITSPRTCEPGPGVLTLTDTGNKYDISGGILVPNAVGVAARDPWLRDATGIARASGLTFFARALRAAGATNSPWFGFATTLTTPGLPQHMGFMPTSATTYKVIGPIDAAFTWATIASGQYHDYYVACRTAGYYWIVNDKLVAVTREGTDTPLYFSIASAVASGNLVSVSEAGVVNAGASFDALMITNTTASPTSPASITHTADGHLTFDWTCATGETLELYVRGTDAENKWIIRASQAGSTLKIIELNTNVETERATAGRTFNNGTVYRLRVHFVANAIYASYGLQASISYTSATFNNTATIGGAAGFATGANLTTYPYTVPSAVQTLLASF